MLKNARDFDSLIDSKKLGALFEDSKSKMNFNCFEFAHVLKPRKLVANKMATKDHLRTVGSLKTVIRKFLFDDLGKSNLSLIDLNAYFEKF